ncbi:hypothetical protein [Neisseria elongata]|nr:hypothetical protein [Neisseria elongata]
MVAQIRQTARLDRGRLKIRFAAQPKRQACFQTAYTQKSPSTC